MLAACRSAAILSALLLGVPAQAQSPLLHALFQDHVVLQRDRPIAVWGQGAAGDQVTVSLAGATAHATADPHGRWNAVLPAMSAGGPYVLVAQSSSGASGSANDVLVGDVFLCSGQSNMELPVLRAGDSQTEINNSANNTIRLLKVEHAVSPTPLLDFRNAVTWQVAAPATVPDWSATCFFFARELQATTHAPIGLLHSSWGGSNIRPWMSASALRGQGYGPALNVLATFAKNPAAAQDQFAAQWEQWWRDKTGDRPGAEPWRTLPSIPRDWRPAPAGLGDWRTWGVPELKNFTGLVWFRTTVRLTAAQAQSAATLLLGPINQVDETWINGRAIGNTFGYGTERSYRVPAGVLHAGVNVIVANVLSTYGSGGLLENKAPRQLRPGRRRIDFPE